MNNTDKKILIVDDSDSIRALIREELSEKGYIIAEAINGNDGLEKIILSGPFDLIISDLNMPECNGLEFLKKTRAENKSRFTPFVIVTTENQIEKKNEARQNGATGWIIKPFQIENLLMVIKKLIG